MDNRDVMPTYMDTHWLTLAFNHFLVLIHTSPEVKCYKRLQRVMLARKWQNANGRYHPTEVSGHLNVLNDK